MKAKKCYDCKYFKEYSSLEDISKNGSPLKWGEPVMATLYYAKCYALPEVMEVKNNRDYRICSLFEKA